MRSLLFVLAAALLLSACGGGSDSKPAGPRKLEVVQLGKDQFGEDLDPEELAAQGDVLWMTNGNSAVSADGKTGKLRTKAQEVPGNPLVYDIAAGDVGVWMVAGDGGKTLLVPVDEESGAPGTPIPLKVDSRFIQAGDGLEVAVGAGRVWATLTGAPKVVAYDPATGKQESFSAGAPVEDIAAGWAITQSDFSGGDAQLVQPDGDHASADLIYDPYDVAVHGEDVFVLSANDVTRFDSTGDEKESADFDDVDATVGTLAVSDDSIWALAYSDTKLIRVDPATHKADSKTFALPEEPRDVAISGGYAYVT